MIFLTIDEVLEIQKSTLSNAPCSDIGKLEGALARIENTHFYEGIDDVLEIAAMYLIAISRAHAFPDGNKRTALLAMVMFLFFNDIKLVDKSLLVDLTIKAAIGKIKRQALVNQLKKLII